MTLPALFSEPVVDVERDRVYLSFRNGLQTQVTIEEARRIMSDPKVAAEFLRRWASPESYRR